MVNGQSHYQTKYGQKTTIDHYGWFGNFEQNEVKRSKVKVTTHDETRCGQQRWKHTDIDSSLSIYVSVNQSINQSINQAFISGSEAHKPYTKQTIKK